MSAIDHFSLLRPWLENLARGLVLFDTEGRCCFANRRALAWVGPGVNGSHLEDLTALFVQAGFAVDSARPNRWVRENETVELVIESRDDGSALVWADEVTARRSSRQKFFSVSAHDLRGALANARSFSSLLLHPKWSLEGKVRHGLEVVVRNVDRALMLSNEIFDSLRAEEAPLDVDLQTVAVRPVLEEAVERARRAAADTEVGIEADLPESFPPWLTDSARLGHLLDTLFQHALSRTPPHGVCRLEVSFPASLSVSRPKAEEADRLLLCVTDGGTETVNLEDLFERDLRVQQTTKLDAGFRLSLARSEALSLGGSLTAEALDSGGLRLQLRLSRSAAHVLAGGAAPTL